MRVFKKTYKDRHNAEQEAKNYTVELRGKDGEPLRFTGCTDKGLSETLGRRIEGLIRHKEISEPLSVELVRFVETAPQKLIKRLLEIGILDPTQAQSGKPLSELLAGFIASRKSAGRATVYVKDLEKRLTELFTAAKCRFWSDLSAQKIEVFLSDLQSTGAAARTVNTYIGALRTFHNFLLDRELVSRPMPGFRKIKLLDTNLDRRHVRRSLTMDELGRLFEVAKTRPLAERQKVNRGEHKGLIGAVLRPETVETLELLGVERYLVYKTAFATGLRRQELQSIRVQDAVLDANPAFLTLAAKNEKSRKGSDLPIRQDLAAELAEFIKLAGRKGADPVFTVPTLRVFKADCTAAGIALVDDAGRAVDFHALRMTLATHLSKSGCSPRTAQAALRHSDIRLTMQIYTDPALLDVAGALERLPMPGTTQARKPVKRA
jgi:site-specific recombinase XerD